MRSTPALLLTLLALAPVVALAHHGWSSYDSSKVLTLTGTIREAGYEHPHGLENRGDEGAIRLIRVDWFRGTQGVLSVQGSSALRSARHERGLQGRPHAST